MSGPEFTAGFVTGYATPEATTAPAREPVDVLVGEVIELLPDFEQVHVMTTEGRLLAITKRTQGVQWHALQEGQRLRFAP